jgi:hypothetical protein
MGGPVSASGLRYWDVMGRSPDPGAVHSPLRFGIECGGVGAHDVADGARRMRLACLRCEGGVMGVESVRWVAETEMLRLEST